MAASCQCRVIQQRPRTSTTRQFQNSTTCVRYLGTVSISIVSLYDTTCEREWGHRRGNRASRRTLSALTTPRSDPKWINPISPSPELTMGNVVSDVFCLPMWTANTSCNGIKILAEDVLPCESVSYPPPHALFGVCLTSSVRQHSRFV
ncbi:hypothetical protein C8Q76DRAFT_338642 [Earliella scabrosa]|nr:hypothetical protein C8Q76DRAFT_338642 [Earliella scabrosa]